MGQTFPAEVAAIISLRKMFPQEKKLRLAKKIVNRTFTYADQNALAKKVSTSRTILSTYSVIRRFDKLQAKLNGAVPVNANLASA